MFKLLLGWIKEQVHKVSFVRANSRQSIKKEDGYTKERNENGQPGQINPALRLIWIAKPAAGMASSPHSTQSLLILIRLEFNLITLLSNSFQDPCKIGNEHESLR